MIRRGYESAGTSQPEGHGRNTGGWRKGLREFSSVTPPRARKPIKRSSSFDNEVKVPPVSRKDRFIIPAVPKFAEPLKSVEVREGGLAEFFCKITGNPPPKVTWMRNQKVLELPTQRMTSEADDNNYILSIDPARVEDRGRYTCVASNNLGRANSTALLNVHLSGGGFKAAGQVFGVSAVKPPTPKLEASSSKASSIGASSKDGERQNFNSCGESVKSSDSGFSRPSSRETCSSSSSYPPSVFSDNVSASSQGLFSPDSVLGSMGSSSDRPPQFSLKPRSHLVEESKSVSFECRVDGTPSPTVTWHKGSTKLQSSERIEISEKQGSYFLKIDDSRPTDAGNYKCVAMNRTGKSTMNFELRLAGRSKDTHECAPTFSQPLTEVEVNEGGRARFECKVEGRPKPTVVWEKDGKEITASSRVRVMEMYGTHSLVLSRTDHADTGTYSISAKNHVGKESCSARLRVKESSYSSSGSTPRGRRSGYDSSEVATPTYSSSGSPATSALSSPSMSPKLGRAANSRLVSGSVSSWTTEAKSRSSSGSGSSTRRRAPGFILRPKPQTVRPGEKIVLKCSLLGHPKPAVTWDRDGVKLDEASDDRVAIREDGNDHFIEIEDCAPDDAGKYTVQAKNSLGRQTATVDIVVFGVTGKRQEKSSRTIDSNDISDKLNNNSSTKTQKLEITINSKNTGSARISSSSSRSISSNEETSYRSRRSNHVAPTFTRRLSSTQVLEGEDLELQCEITGTPTPELTWTRNGAAISHREPNTTTELKNGVATLRVSKVKPSHAGEYLCLAKNDAGDSKCSSRVTVKTKQRQSKPKFIRPPKDVRIEEGQTLSLEAEVSGMPSPEVLWSLDGEEISDGDCFYKNNIAKLVLRNVSLASSGQYMCTAINDAGEDSAACRVRIKQKRQDIPPEFTAPLSDIKTKEGKDISLRCMVTGIPEPRVQWCLNEEVLEAGDGLDMSFQDGVAALTLEQVTPEDTGCYSCIAVNKEGRASTSCQVVVSELPEKALPMVERAPEFVSKYEDYTRAMEGDTVTLECQVRGSPEPEITWTIDRKPVKGSEQTFENGRAILTINSITPDHGGSVVCLAKNSAGQAKHEGRLYIRAKREAPSFATKLPESVEVEEGEEVTFGCQVKGHPQPRVTWSRNGRSLSVLNSETSYEEGNATVRIRKAGNSDGGKYVCTARNLSGESETSCVVTVCTKREVQRPSFVRPLKDISLHKGEDIRLECEIAKSNDVEITWIFDGQKLEADDGEASYKDGIALMVLEDARNDDSGVYECVAKNKGGETRTSCRVEVTAKKPTEEGPFFPVQLEDMTINEDQDIYLKCQVKGNPRPTITWLLDGDPLDADFKYSEDGVVEVLLPGALPDDEGVYTCIAQNKLKRVMCSCKVTVKPFPKPSKGGTASKAAPEPKVEPKKSPASSNKSTPTSSATRMNGTATSSVRKSRLSDSEPAQEGPERPPTFLEDLQDRVVPDGSINYRLTARVAGVPPPVVKWYLEGEEIEETDDFKYETDAETRTLVFAEIFPEDSGTYTCVARNSAGEARADMKMTVEEIDGDPPNFIIKPRPLTVNAGENALLTCKVDGEPTPTVRWLYCNRPISANERIIIETPNSNNNYMHSLEICESRIEDAGRYAACSSNLLGDVTCTVSLIVNAAKNQEGRKDFRDVLKPSASKSKSTEASQPEQLDFRGVLKKTDGPLSPEPSPGRKDEDQPDFREVLQRPVRTKVLSEDERKMLKAEQKDFRFNLVRKVDTKSVTNEALKSKQAEQKDFRDEAIKIKVKTKAYAEEAIKSKQPEQKDFRGEALKTKVVTKAFKEENLKKKRAEQVDFREVLSPKRHSSKEDSEPAAESTKFELPASPAKMKINKEKMEHNTVATRRTRARGAEPTVRKAKSIEREEPKGSAPEILDALKDVKVKDSEPFELVCRVTGDPAPKISWFLEEEEISADTDISITREGDVCKLHVAESFPDDEGTYVLRAENEHGVVKSSAHVTVVEDDPKSDTARPIFVKKQSSVTDPAIPACVRDGPQDCTVLRGNPVSLCCALGGTPPLKSVWRKGKNEIKSSKQCCIDLTNTSAALTIKRSEKDDSGCYTLQVKNSGGVDQYSINVSIVDVPDPPGKPYASDIAGSSLVLSWYGTGYDGGSSVTGYRVEVAEVTSSTKPLRWSAAASTKSTTCTVKDLTPNSKYIFRVCAENKYGTSSPGQQSDVVLNTVTEVVDSSEDEEAFVKHGAVSIKTDGTFSQTYETKERLGQGRFGKVHRVVNRHTGKEYAAKIMRALKAKDKEAVQQEIDIMNSLRHPRLVQLIDAYSHGREITMVMDLVSGGELFERVIDEDFELTEAACIKYMSQICDGLQYMHDTLILHLDLKPENIMCINKTGTQIKIIDFGLARRYNPKEVIRVMFGTPEFVAPEVINYDAIGPQTDMWSVGVICYILLSGLSPFMGDNDTETLSNITAAEWDFDDESFDDISHEAKDFIRQLLVKNLDKRYTVKKALEHKWLKKDTNKMKKSKLNTKNLKRFLARRKWQKTGNAVRALGRLASLANLGSTQSNPNKISNGQPRESGFLAALKAQLLRENEEEQESHDNCKPMFETLFDDVEVIEGSAAKFECTIIGTPDPEIMWFKDGEPIKESRRFKISYTEDDVCTLLITDATEADEAEYSCKAVNCEGETEHRAELIVITPGV